MKYIKILTASAEERLKKDESKPLKTDEVYEGHYIKKEGLELVDDDFNIEEYKGEVEWAERKIRVASPFLYWWFEERALDCLGDRIKEDKDSGEEKKIMPPDREILCYLLERYYYIEYDNIRKYIGEVVSSYFVDQIFGNIFEEEDKEKIKMEYECSSYPMRADYFSITSNKHYNFEEASKLKYNDIERMYGNIFFQNEEGKDLFSYEGSGDIYITFDTETKIIDYYPENLDDLCLLDKVIDYIEEKHGIKHPGYNTNLKEYTLKLIESKILSPIEMKYEGNNINISIGYKEVKLDDRGYEYIENEKTKESQELLYDRVAKYLQTNNL